MFQNVFQKWTSKFWVIRSNSAPLSSGSMAYLPEVKKELAATPAEGEEALHRKNKSLVFAQNIHRQNEDKGKKKIIIGIAEGRNNSKEATGARKQHHWNILMRIQNEK